MRNLKTLPHLGRSLFEELVVLAPLVLHAVQRLPSACGPLVSWELLLALVPELKSVLARRW